MRPIGHCVFLLPLILLAASVSFAQTNPDDYLRVAPSKLQLRASNVRFTGKPVKRGDYTERGPKLTHDRFVYFWSDVYEDGLIARDIKTGTATVYQPTELALAAGWIKKEKDLRPRNNVWGIERSGDQIWMGTDGFGILSFDTKTKLWERHDFSSDAKPGRGKFFIFYADEDYVFAAGFNIYSIKHKRWLRIEAVPVRYVRSFGHNTGGMPVQILFDLRRYAKEKYLPLTEPNYSPLYWPDEMKLTEDGSSYVLRFQPKESPTEFIIEKWQLDWAFSQAQLNRAPQQAGVN